MMKRENSDIMLGHGPPQGKAHRDVFHNAAEILSHPLDHYHFQQRGKKNYSKVDWQKTLGPYSPEKNYHSYKKEYNRKLQAATTPQHREQLQNAWRAMRKHGMTQNKRGLNRQLLGVRDAKAREELKRRFREHRMNTGPVPLPALTVPKYTKEEAMKAAARRARRHEKAHPGATDSARRRVERKYALHEAETKAMRAKLKRIIPSWYKAANETSVRTHGRSITKRIQGKFFRDFDTILGQILLAKKSTITRYGGSAVRGAVGVAAAACARMFPFFGISTAVASVLFGAIAKMLATGAISGLLERHYDRLRQILETAVGNPAAAAGRTGALVAAGMVAVEAQAKFRKDVMNALNAIVQGDSGFVGGLVKRILNVSEKFGSCYGAKIFTEIVAEVFNLNLQAYIGHQIEVPQLVRVLEKHATTVKMFLLGKDVSLEPLLVSLVNVINSRDVQIAWAKLHIT